MRDDFVRCASWCGADSGAVTGVTGWVTAIAGRPPRARNLDVRGGRVNLSNRDEVVQAHRATADSVAVKAGAKSISGCQGATHIRAGGYELILASSVDPQFAPVLLFGSGGQLVEVYRDRVLGQPPLNTTLARRLMERTKVFADLQGARGRKAVD